MTDNDLLARADEEIPQLRDDLAAARSDIDRVTRIVEALATENAAV